MVPQHVPERKFRNGLRDGPPTVPDDHELAGDPGESVEQVTGQQYGAPSSPGLPP
ncbi:hypothetical protein [Nocardiopsis kunsanensis]|uniref:hypothetical protein n=1 Tax=Nocardiopsis kunsanensis TaxID=141693 RepID=UPI000374F57D|nr:hypothetical protein [Nocardiopsis kunsanensis]